MTGFINKLFGLGGAKAMTGQGVPRNSETTADNTVTFHWKSPAVRRMLLPPFGKN